MVRIILGIIIGYLAIAIIVFAGLSAAWLILGPERAFQPGVYDLAPAWGIAAVVVNIIAAITGGVICRKLSRTPTGHRVFAIIVFILGLLVALPTLQADDEPPAVRPSEIPMLEAMRDAKQPTWFAFTNPFVAAIGIMLGGAGQSAGGRKRLAMGEDDS